MMMQKFLEGLPRTPQLLALGEPVHGAEAFPRLRNEILRNLVEEAGFRSIAIESDCLAGLLVEDYIRTGTGDLDEVMTHFSHGFGAYAGNRELVEWLRDCDEEVRFYGFDGPLELYAESPRSALLYAYDFVGLMPGVREEIVGLCGDDERWANPASVMDPAQSVGSAPEVTRLRVVADDLRTLLVAEAPRLVAETSVDAWWLADLHLRTAARVLQYHAALAQDTPERVNRLMVLRDAMMAENLLAIAERERDRGPTLVFASNGHLHRQLGRWDMAGPILRWWPAGAIAATRLGDDYAYIAGALGSCPDKGIPAPAQDTVEGWLAGLPGDRQLLAGRSLAGGLKPRNDAPPTAGYFPLDPEDLAKADGVVFLREV